MWLYISYNLPIYFAIFTQFMHGRLTLKMLIRFSFTTAPCSHILLWVLGIIIIIIIIDFDYYFVIFMHVGDRSTGGCVGGIGEECP